MQRALVVVLALIAPLWAERAAAAGALIIASEQPAFAEAARRAKEVLGANGEIVAPGDVAQASSKQPRVVIAIGPLAERMAASAMSPDGRAVACLTARSNGLPVGRTTLVGLYPSADELVATVKAALPGVARVGVLGKTDGAAARGLVRAAQSKGLSVVEQREGEPFNEAVDRLLGETDAIWIQDAQALPGAGQGLALVLKRALDRRKPVIGPNRAAVADGALLAIVPDPGAQGRVAGELADAILRGLVVGDTATAPGKLIYNERVERALGVRIPDAVKQAGEAIR